MKSPAFLKPSAFTDAAKAEADHVVAIGQRGLLILAILASHGQLTGAELDRECVLLGEKQGASHRMVHDLVYRGLVAIVDGGIPAFVLTAEGALLVRA